MIVPRRPRGRLLGLLMLGALLAASTRALGQVDAVSSARYDLKLGFTVGGKVTRLYVKKGDVVAAGDPLIELDDNEGLAQIEIWKFRAQSDTAVNAARERQKLALLEEKRVRELVQRSAAVEFELTRAEVQTRIEALNVEQAVMEKTEAGRQLEIYQARHDRYLLRAERAGRIDELTVEEGEMVEELKPIVRLVVTELLRVQAAVPTGQTLKLKPGDPAWVTAKLPGYEQPVEGRITHLAVVVDSASDTRMVEIEVANPMNLPAGVQVSVTFTRPEALASAASSPAGKQTP